MGAKTCMMGFSDGDLARQLHTLPSPDRGASTALAAALFARDKLTPLPDSDLGETFALDGEVLVSRFGSAGVAVSTDFAIDHPSKLPTAFLKAAGPMPTVCLHAMHSAVDWFAFALWQNGRLVRSLSVAPDSGVMEDIGERLPFELPFWRGDHPADDPAELEAGETPYPLPFHPLELGEATLREFFGFTIEGVVSADELDPHAVPLMRFKRSKSRFKFWR